MKKSILLITGWGSGTQLLDSLKLILQHRRHSVDLINIFNALDPEVLQQKVELAYPYDVIVGWSLGGQLATLLVDQIERQYAEKKILITLASNPCFVANEVWPTAMPQATFQAFKHAFQRDAITTLKRFGYMVCQGVDSSKTDFAILQSLIQAQPISLLEQGLVLLEQLNVVDILKNYQGQQYHILFEQDALVSCKVVENIQQFNAKFLEVELIQGSHGFPIFNFETVSHKICQYLQKIE
ncbi:hydrolase [Acinetobacter sp. ANC 4648]|uniref:hydrolase n=1 Tax=Acinetobacter sp. ANC 4648 TaxID=1977875 RepID=UPI000A355248|nr:hydrolase [Acinetobacter sp. ANC 4648]OTG83902.1 hydrolase [Acinetobacter sp. ANC 4648]